MRERSGRGGKLHCEAFPAIDLPAAERGWRDAHRSCEWRNEQGRVVGTGRLLVLDGEAAEFSYDFTSSINIEPASGKLRVGITGTRLNPHVVRKRFVCPCCSTSAHKLLIVSAIWACRTCHNLVHLTQRLGDVNKKIYDRDILTAELQQCNVSRGKTRWHHNQSRRLDRMNRELAEIGATVLPAELQWRIHDRWLTAGEITQAESPALHAKTDPTSALIDAPGTHRLSPTRLTTPECRLIGSPILDRTLSPSFQERAGGVRSELLRLRSQSAREGSFMSDEELAVLLAQRLRFRPLTITNDWSDMAATVTSDGLTECSITASYEGDPTLWRIGAIDEAAEPMLRAILDDAAITLRVRSIKAGRFDLAGRLDAARRDLVSRLQGIGEALNGLNDNDLLDRARVWIEVADAHPSTNMFRLSAG